MVAAVYEGAKLGGVPTGNLEADRLKSEDW